jgi:hypothetical protein
MKEFTDRKAVLKTHFPKIKGWIDWWSLPVHAVLLFSCIRKDMLEETDEMYDRLPSTNNNSEGTNSMESRLCKHNVELVPAIMDSYRVTIRQQKQHLGVLSGQVKQKVSPVKHPVLTARRQSTQDFDQRCPDRGSIASTRKRVRAEPVDPAKAAKKNINCCQPILKVHTDQDRIARVNAMIMKKEVTVGFFVEIFPEPSSVQDQSDRWFMEVTQNKISNGNIHGTWCKANSLTAESKTVHGQPLGSVKDYGDRSTFINV